ncbi:MULTISPECIES: hypothetical protein [unclassified Streptomyces]|uniref:hypothetical protein n=1 Tax=unclassified Streptomyces TaxID=2593676 RepID=UPI003421EE1F
MSEEIWNHVREAVDHWAEGRRRESVQILAMLAETQQPRTMYAVALCIGTVAKAALTKMHGRHSHVDFWGIRTLDGSRPEDTVPAPDLFAARFITAHLNNDTDTTLALYLAAYRSNDPDLFPACMRTLLAAAGEAVIAATPGADR